MTLDEIDTPAVLIDLDRAMRNIQRAQDYADTHGLKLRPHIKTHKLPFFAHAQIKAGAIGITCQKLGEAEVMADAGLTDIFLPYNILGAAKLARLKALHGRIRISVTADSIITVDGYGEAFTDPARPLPVLVECDTGMGRCGVQTPDEAVALARAIAARPGLRFRGLMTYPAAGGAKPAQEWLQQAIAALKAAGLDCPIVSTGGTPDLWHAHETDIQSEYRPGTYIYLDRFQVARNVGTLDDCALTVLTTVVSRPTERRAIIDAGSKSLTSDTLGLETYGEMLGNPAITVAGLSEEHGTLDCTAAPAALAVGDRIRIVPNHSCVVSNLFDKVHLIRSNTVIDVLPVAARGKVG